MIFLIYKITDLTLLIVFFMVWMYTNIKHPLRNCLRSGFKYCAIRGAFKDMES